MKPNRPYFFKSSFVCFLMTRFLRNGKFRLPDKAAGFIPNLKKLESWQLVRWIVKRYVGKIVFLLFILVGRWLMILLRQIANQWSFQFIRRSTRFFHSAQFPLFIYKRKLHGCIIIITAALTSYFHIGLGWAWIYTYYLRMYLAMRY